MIDRKENKDKTEYNLDRIVQASFGYSDEQLLEQMKQAEETVSDTQIPPESEHGFEELIAKADSRGVTPYTEAKDSGEGEDRKIRRLGSIVKVGLAVAVMTSVLLMTSITAGAKRSYKYEAKTRVEMADSVVLRNDYKVLDSDPLNVAYIDIRDTIGISVLTLSYKPKGFNYQKMSISGERAMLYFTYNGESVFLIQQIGNRDNLLNLVSERSNEDKVYNVWLQQEIPIRCATVNSGQEEFSMQLIKDNTFYYFSGIMEENEFKKIVQEMKFMEDSNEK